MIGVLAAVFIVAVLAGQALVVTRLRQGAGSGAADEWDRSPQAGAAPAAYAAAATPAATAPGMVGVLRRRRWLRRSLSFASVAIMLVAVGMIGYPFYTNLYADRLQSQLSNQFTSDELRQDYEARNVQEGDSLTRIQIPAIDVDVVVVEGVSPSALRAGAGHYPSTPLPCEDGNVAIAGHRTTYGRPFHNLDLLQPGDEIILTTPIGACKYSVQDQTIVRPSDVSVVQNQGDNRLTLTTCHPKGSARQRLVISATLVGPVDPPA